MFALHQQLAKDCTELGVLPLCKVLLMNNALFPWIILVPARANLKEVTDLSAQSRAELMEEIASVSSALQTHTKANKMNIAALGNQVPQLHIHIIARFEGDAAWPNPVWGRGAETYAQEKLSATIDALRQQFSALIPGFSA